jgi:hypothetical protein
VEDSTGKIKTKQTAQKFQVGMMEAPCVDGCNSWAWYSFFVLIFRGAFFFLILNVANR